MPSVGEHKTGRSVRAIGAPARDLLSDLLSCGQYKFLFPNESGTGTYGGLGRVWDDVRMRANLLDVTLHTLRHTFASVGANEFDYSASTIGALLGHRSAGITEKYIHRIDAPLITAADKIARWIDRAMRGAQAATAEVIALRA